MATRVRLPLFVAAAAVISIGGVGGCSSDKSADPAKFCSHYRSAANSGAMIGNVDAVSVDDFKAGLKTASSEALAAAEAAPGDIHSQARRIADAIQKFDAAAQGATDRTQLEQAVKAYAAAAAERRADSDAVASWAAQHCGVTTVATTTTVTAPPTSAQGG